jgi:hypothetical protein
MMGELVEKLSIANMKLFKVCDKKADIARNPGDFSKSEIVDVIRRDIELCKQRASLKNQIDKTLNQAIMDGKASVVDEVKSYGAS